jgi:hypothetical protein
VHLEYLGWRDHGTFPLLLFLGVEDTRRAIAR